MTDLDLTAIRARAEAINLGEPASLISALAVDAHKDRAALLDLVDALAARLEAVRELHRKVTRYGDDEYSIPADEYLETPDEHPGLEPFDVCAHCMDIETTVQGDNVHWIGIESAWPCPTIQAIDGN